MTMADLILENDGYSGGTTAIDAAFASVPWLNFDGDRLVARQSAAIASATRCPVLLASSFKEYENMAVQLATEESGRKQLQEIRDCLISHRYNDLENPLFNSTNFVSSLEKAVLKAWEVYDKKLEPTDIDVSHG